MQTPSHVVTSSKRLPGGQGVPAIRTWLPLHTGSFNGEHLKCSLVPGPPGVILPPSLLLFCSPSSSLPGGEKSPDHAQQRQLSRPQSQNASARLRTATAAPRQPLGTHTKTWSHACRDMGTNGVTEKTERASTRGDRQEPTVTLSLFLSL